MKFSLSAWLDEALSHKRLWLLLFLLSVLTIYDIPTAELFHFGKWYVAGYLLGVGILKASIIVLLLSPLLKRRRLRPIAWVLVALYGMIGAINAVSASLYGFGITRKLMVVVAQTNPYRSGGVPARVDVKPALGGIEPADMVRFDCARGFFCVYKEDWP